MQRSDPNRRPPLTPKEQSTWHNPMYKHIQELIRKHKEKYATTTKKNK